MVGSYSTFEPPDQGFDVGVTGLEPGTSTVSW